MLGLKRHFETFGKLYSSSAHSHTQQQRYARCAKELTSGGRSSASRDDSADGHSAQNLPFLRTYQLDHRRIAFKALGVPIGKLSGVAPSHPSSANEAKLRSIAGQVLRIASLTFAAEPGPPKGWRRRLRGAWECVRSLPHAVLSHGLVNFTAPPLSEGTSLGMTSFCRPIPSCANPILPT